MAYQEPDNGTIFLRENKSQNPKAPKWKGDGKDDQGRKVEIAIWEGHGNKGPWRRLVIKPAYNGQQHGDFGQMRQQVDRNVSDVPTPEPPKEEQTDIPF